MLLYHLPCHPLDHRSVSAIELGDERESTPMSEANPSNSADAKLGREIATMACEDVALISIALEAAALLGLGITRSASDATACTSCQRRFSLALLDRPASGARRAPRELEPADFPRLASDQLGRRGRASSLDRMRTRGAFPGSFPEADRATRAYSRPRQTGLQVVRTLASLTVLCLTNNPRGLRRL